MMRTKQKKKPLINHLSKMKKIIVCIAMMLAFGMNSSSANAQSVQRVGNTFVATKSTTKSEPRKTQFMYEAGDGKKYPIYVSSTGACFVYRVSSKTGKQYKQYLGKEISKQVCKELNIQYKSNNKQYYENLHCIILHFSSNDSCYRISCDDVQRNHST